jgi:hypothetical protein
MRRLPLLILAAVLAGALALSASATSPPTTTLQFLGVSSNYNFTGSPNPNAPPKLGDLFSFQITLYKWSGDKRGSMSGGVSVLGVALSSSMNSVSAVATLPGGTLVIEGNSGNGRGVLLAVTGGTGSYAGARGEVITRNIGGPNSSKSGITIRLWQ